MKYKMLKRPHRNFLLLLLGSLFCVAPLTGREVNVRMVTIENPINDLLLMTSEGLIETKIDPFLLSAYQTVQLQGQHFRLFQQSQIPGEPPRIVGQLAVPPEWESMTVLAVPQKDKELPIQLFGYPDDWDAFGRSHIRVINATPRESVGSVGENRFRCEPFGSTSIEAKPTTPRPKVTVKLATQDFSDEWIVLENKKTTIIPRWRITKFIFVTRGGLQKLIEPGTNENSAMPEVSYVIFEHKDTYTGQ